MECQIEFYPLHRNFWNTSGAWVIVKTLNVQSFLVQVPNWLFQDVHGGWSIGHRYLVRAECWLQDSACSFRYIIFWRQESLITGTTGTPFSCQRQHYSLLFLWFVVFHELAKHTDVQCTSWFLLLLLQAWQLYLLFKTRQTIFSQITTQTRFPTFLIY